MTGIRSTPQQRQLTALAAASPYVVQRWGPAGRELTAEAWRQALLVALARHPVLRTRLRSAPGFKVPLQVVEDSPTLAWREVDGELANVASAERQQPFDLAAGALVRGAWVRGAGGDGWVLTLPAANADLASLDALLAGLPAGLPAATSPMPPAPEASFGQVAEWQAELLANEEPAAEVAAEWRRALAEAAAGRLPFDHGDGQASPPALTWTPLSARESEALARLAAATGASPSTVLLTAWHVLLALLAAPSPAAGEGLVSVVATAVPGRVFAEIAGVLGPLDALLPVRGRLHRDLRFAEAVERVAAATAEAAENQPFFSPELYPGRPLYGFESEPADEADGTVEAGCFAWRQDLHLKLAPRLGGRRPGLALYYATAAVATPEAERLLAGLGELLVAATPESRLGRLQLVPAADRERLAELSAGAPLAEVPAPVGRQIAEAARRHPRRPAVVMAGETLPYGELMVAAQAVAAALLAQGLEPEERVAVPAERSPDAVVALLGVLLAGGAYLPLDRSWPDERQALLAAEAGVRLSVGAGPAPAALAPRLVAHLDVAALRATADAAAPVAAGPDPLPAQLAYVLFTSGSTGRPKGVGVEHRQLSQYVAAVSQRLGLTGERSYALTSTLAADLGLTMLFPALTLGGTLHLVPEATAADAAAFAALMQAAGIEVLKIVPSHLEALLSHERPAEVLPRRLLVLGGEAASPRLLALLAAHLPAGAALANHYGPTETTVGVTADRVEGPAFASTPLSLGRPLAGVSLHLLADGLPVPFWAAGELAIGGASVSRGYLGRPRATAERFRPDPFAGSPGARLYLTGDLGRRRPDGHLQFLGRRDQQVKVRGFRIETGEIAAALTSHPEVREAVVVLRDDELVGYYVVGSTARVSPGELAARLAAQLPAPLLPAALVPLAALPLTANGKLDRAALPAPETRTAERRAPVPPRDDLDELVAGQWRAVLKREDVGIDDDFFALGGHSLLATQLLSRLRGAFTLELPMRVIFDGPTVRQLAAAIEALEPEPGYARKVAAAHGRLARLSDQEVEALLAAENEAPR